MTFTLKSTSSDRHRTSDMSDAPTHNKFEPIYSGFLDFMADDVEPRTGFLSDDVLFGMFMVNFIEFLLKNVGSDMSCFLSDDPAYFGSLVCVCEPLWRRV